MAGTSLGFVGIANKGTYDAATHYLYMNFVLYDGSTYLCINKDGCTGVTPTDDKTNWQFLAHGLTADDIAKLDPATASKVGLVKPDDSSIQVDENGTISAKPASATVLGAVKIGTGIDVAEDGTISAQKVGNATATEAGIVKIGDGINVTDDGTISAQKVNNATASEAGIVRVGTGLNVETDGTLSSDVYTSGSGSAVIGTTTYNGTSHVTVTI